MNIAQVSQKYGLSADTLRYYEKEGLLPPITRNASGQRDYTPTDCNWVEFIKCMRAAGLSIETLREYVRLFYQGNRTLQKRKQLLMRERDALKIRVQEQQAVVKRLNPKIDIYEEQIVAYEKNLRP